MKNIWIVLGMLLWGSGLMAQGSNLVIFSESGDPFTLVVNQQQLNRRPVTNIRVTNLPPGLFRVRLMPINPAIPAMELEIQIERDREITYALVAGFQGQRQLAFVNEFSLAFNPVPPLQQLLVEYQAGALVPGIAQPNPGIPQPGNPQIVPNGGGQVALPPEPQGPPSPMPGYNGPVGCNGPFLSPEEFENALSSIRAKTFSSSQLTLAKQIARSNCLFADQVAEVISIFEYESDRLDYAKFAFDFTFDQGNYYKVNDSFKFESSIDNLEKFLMGKR